LVVNIDAVVDTTFTLDKSKSLQLIGFNMIYVVLIEKVRRRIITLF